MNFTLATPLEKLITIICVYLLLLLLLLIFQGGVANVKFILLQVPMVDTVGKVHHDVIIQVVKYLKLKQEFIPSFSTDK